LNAERSARLAIPSSFVELARFELPSDVFAAVATSRGATPVPPSAVLAWSLVLRYDDATVVSAATAALANVEIDGAATSAAESAPKPVARLEWVPSTLIDGSWAGARARDEENAVAAAARDEALLALLPSSPPLDLRALAIDCGASRGSSLLAISIFFRASGASGSALHNLVKSLLDRSRAAREAVKRDADASVSSIRAERDKLNTVLNATLDDFAKYKTKAASALKAAERNPLGPGAIPAQPQTLPVQPPAAAASTEVNVMRLRVAELESALSEMTEARAAAEYRVNTLSDRIATLTERNKESLAALTSMRSELTAAAERYSTDSVQREEAMAAARLAADKAVAEASATASAASTKALDAAHELVRSTRREVEDLNSQLAVSRRELSEARTSLERAEASIALARADTAASHSDARFPAASQVTPARAAPAALLQQQPAQPAPPTVVTTTTIPSPLPAVSGQSPDGMSILLDRLITGAASGGAGTSGAPFPPPFSSPISVANYQNHGLYQPYHSGGAPSPGARSVGAHSRAEDDFEADAAVDEVEMLQRAAASATADANEARRDAELLRSQCDVLKEALRDAARASERESTLRGDGGGNSSTSAPMPMANLTFLKNAVVAYMATRNIAEQRRMLPAISLLLRLSPTEVARIAATLDSSSAAPIAGAVGGAASGLLGLVKKGVSVLGSISSPLSNSGN
jgi:hypothetical protein